MFTFCVVAMVVLVLFVYVLWLLLLIFMVAVGCMFVSGLDMSGGFVVPVSSEMTVGCLPSC